MADETDAIDRADLLEAESAAWFNELPSVQVAAACVLRDGDGRVLIVDPTYKPQWELPGGAAELGESPFDACRREIREELSIEITPLQLLCVDHQSMRPPRRGALRFVFDGGCLGAYVKPTVAVRVRTGLAAPGSYLEQGLPLAGGIETRSRSVG